MSETTYSFTLEHDFSQPPKYKHVRVEGRHQLDAEDNLQVPRGWRVIQCWELSDLTSAAEETPVP